MPDLLTILREESSPTIFERAEKLARGASLMGKKRPDGDLSVRLRTRGGMLTPEVLLSEAHGDWSCECESPENPCIHAVACAIVLAQKQEDQEQRFAGETRAELRYRLTKTGRALGIVRELVRGAQGQEGDPIPVVERLSTFRTLRRIQFEVRLEDVEIDHILEGKDFSKGIPKAFVPLLLRQLEKVPRLSFEGKKVRIGEPRPATKVIVEDGPMAPGSDADKRGFVLRAAPDPKLSERFDNGAARWGGVVAAVEMPRLAAGELEELDRGRGYAFDQVAELVATVLPALRDRVSVEERTDRLPKIEPMRPEIVLYSTLDRGILEVQPFLSYGDPPSARVEGGRLRYFGGPVPDRFPRLERRLIEELRRVLDMVPERPHRAHGEDAVTLAQRIRAAGYKTRGAGLAEAFLAAAPLTPTWGDDGVRFTVDHEGEEREADAAAVLAAYESGRGTVALIAGGWAELPDGWLERHGHLVRSLLEARAAGEGPPPPHLAFEVARLAKAIEAPPPPSMAKLKSLADAFDDRPAPALPSDLKAELRPYQVDGVAWLAFLVEAGMGGLLADDMGLGKTLQALCVIRAPALVVCPASVLHAWQEQIARFRPALSVCLYHGPKRELTEADVTLTTYALLRGDREILTGREWATAILDESQTIKNPDAQVSRAAHAIKAGFRLALTGTPVENRLSDLWSQLHFLSPGLLGSEREFEARWSRPIESGDAVQAERLRRKIRPFLLRRKKSEVAQDLPPRTEVTLHCTLTSEERALYEAVLAASLEEVVRRLEQGGGVMAALEALLRMRQACCHRGLLPGQEAPSSSKIELLMETLETTIEEGHRSLIFSQWTSFLDLLEPHLRAAGHRFIRLDGSTRDRASVVEAFQAEDGPELMLISLKAGGTGLTLTAADHVFLLDPWWNPAVEDQAADRAHRIGQDRPVIVHRLVAEATVEERLLALQDKKRALADAAISGALSGGLTKEDLLGLFV